MKYPTISVAITAVALLLGTGPSIAADAKAAAPLPASSQSKTSSKALTKPKAAVKVKLVDINSASAAELKTLPGISDTEAAKIIAGRPYGSQAWLVTQKILDMAAYQQLKDLIVARQPSKDAAKNAALYSKKK